MMTKWLEWMFVTFLNEKAISLVLQYGILEKLVTFMRYKTKNSHNLISRNVKDFFSRSWVYNATFILFCRPPIPQRSLSTSSESRPSVPGKPLAATMAAVKQQQLQQLQMQQQQQQQNNRTSLPNFNLNKEDMGMLHLTSSLWRH